MLTQSINALGSKEGQSGVVEQALARRARFSLQKEKKPQFYWENSTYIDNIEKFKDLSLQRELNMCDSSQSDSSPRAY